MKKITKILLPIAASISTVAPIVCLASCSSSHYENVIKVNLHNSFVEGVSFAAKQGKLDNTKTVIPSFKSISLPNGVKAPLGINVTIIANTKAVVITLVGDLTVDENLPDGSSIIIKAELIGLDADDKQIWKESSVTFEIAHDAKVQ